MTSTPDRSARRPKVVVTQHRLLHYRQELLDRIRKGCEARGIQMELLHGQASPTEALKKDVGSLPWAHVVHNRYLSIGGRDLLWQPFPADLRDADLVIFIQENRLLSNYPWLLRWGVRRGQRVGYWGHGRNLQSTAPDGWRERWKRWFVGRVDWWFAYTDGTRAILESDGFPRERITVLNNAIDNQRFVADLEAVTPQQRAACLSRIGAAEGDPVGLYCGSLYVDKRLDLLVEAADLIRERQPGFKLVIVGDGPSRDIITQAQKTRPWLHAVGVQRGVEKAAWFSISNAYLSPGAVGLHVLDAFCAGIPMITTTSARHGPEVSYLVSGRNGFIVDDNARAYADAYLGLLDSPQRMAAVRRAAQEDAQLYTLDHMVDRFVQGVVDCLALPPK